MNTLIIRDTRTFPTLVFVIAGIERNRGENSVPSCKSLQQSELSIQFSDPINQHLVMSGIRGCFQLSREVSAGQQKALPLAVPLLLSHSRTRTARGTAIHHLGLLLLNRLTFKAACHNGNPVLINP
jgi:hypothetical protein